MKKEQQDKKKCLSCGQSLPVNHFFVVPGNSAGDDWYISKICETCHVKASKEILNHLRKAIKDEDDKPTKRR